MKLIFILEVKTDIKDFVPESEQMTTDLIEARDEGGRSGDGGGLKHLEQQSSHNG